MANPVKGDREIDNSIHREALDLYNKIVVYEINLDTDTWRTLLRLSLSLTAKAIDYLFIRTKQSIGGKTQ